MKTTILTIAAVVSAALTAQGAWSIGDPHKMHYPQLPDPNGWDVNVHDFTLADDWQCSQTGLVSDAHLWLSWEQDNGGPSAISTITLSIHEDIAAGAQTPWSQPGTQVWGGTYTQGQFNFNGPLTGDQGFISDPGIPAWARPDHQNYWQINIDDLSNGMTVPLFTQQQGNIYWLDVNIQTDSGGVVGWKTSLNPFNDVAVYRDPTSGLWEPIVDPFAGPGFDMAFVITPEPGTTTLALLGVGLLLRRRR